MQLSLFFKNCKKILLHKKICPHHKVVYRMTIKQDEEESKARVRGPSREEEPRSRQRIGERGSRQGFFFLCEIENRRVRELFFSLSPKAFARMAGEEPQLHTKK